MNMEKGKTLSKLKVIFGIFFVFLFSFSGPFTSAMTNQVPSLSPEYQGDDPWDERSPQAKNDSGRIEAATPVGDVTIGLVNQMDYQSDWGIVSENFRIYNSWDAKAADDFTIPASDVSWTVESVDVIGFCRDLDFNPYDCGNSLKTAEVIFYKNAGPIPTNLYYSTKAYNDIGVESVSAGSYLGGNLRIYTINISTPVVLPAGDYWISVVMDMDIEAGDFLWNQRTVQNGDAFAWVNPGGAWGGGCTSWCAGYGSYPDLNFRLNGVVANPYKVELQTAEPYSIVEHSSQPLIYASISGAGEIIVINTETEAIVDTIFLGGSYPKGLALSPDSSLLYVAISVTVNVIDTSTFTKIDTINIDNGDKKQQLAYGGPGRLYVSEDGNNDIFIIDPTTGSWIGTLPHHDYVGEHITISPDGQTLCSSRNETYRNSIACFDVSTDSPPPPRVIDDVGNNVTSLDISSDSKLLYVSTTRLQVYDLTTLVLEWETSNYQGFPFTIDSYLGDKVFISSRYGGAWGWDAQSHQPEQYLEHENIVFMCAGKDNRSVYAKERNSNKLIIYRYTTFGDLSWKHWAKNWIEGIYSAGLTSGYPDGTYRPQNPVTRAEMAIFLLKGMGITPPALDGSHPFSDISGHWAEAWIEELYDQGITGGYPDGTYRPENQVTRAEMAIFLLKGKGVSPSLLDGSHPFSDIGGHWAEAYIEELYDQGITGGYPDGTYRPENQVTRAEMAVFLVNSFGLSLP